jgi:hypothetical protein
MSSRMDVLDFDFEVLSLEESFKLFPKFIKVIPSNWVTEIDGF